MPWLKPNKDTSPFPNYSYWGYSHMENIEVKDKMGIYAIINENNKNIYIGSSVNMYRRWNDHKKMLIKNTHHSKHLQNSWNKNGENSFTFTVLEIVGDKENLMQREQYYLDFMGPIYNTNRLAGTFKGGDKNFMYEVRNFGKDNHMFGRKRADTAEFNTRTKKGKSYEERYGLLRAKEIRDKISKNHKSNKCQNIQ